MSDRLKPLTILLISALLLSSNVLSNKKNYNNKIAYRNEATKEQSHLNLNRQKGESPSHCTKSPSPNSFLIHQTVCCDTEIEFVGRNQLKGSIKDLGFLSKIVQSAIQKRYNTSYEVILSDADFVISTYYSGPHLCKFLAGKYFVSIYETPVKYNITNLMTEDLLSSVDYRDPLGWKGSMRTTENLDLSQNSNRTMDSKPRILQYMKETKRKTKKTRTKHLFSDKKYTSIVDFITERSFSGLSAINGAHFSTKKNWTKNRQYRQDQTACAWRGGMTNPLIPYQFQSIECCDGRLETFMREAIAVGISTPKLGDAAKFIQRRAQLAYGLSFETIISRSNFAISTYYHGVTSCKIYDGRYYYLVYATPQQYDPFNLAVEDQLASMDAEERLGGTKEINIRGNHPDVREDPSAGEDISIQPTILAARALNPPNGSSQGQGSLVDIVTMNALRVGAIRQGGDHIGLEFNPPSGSHCNKQMRGGNKCCDSALHETMHDAVYDLSSSPQFGLRSVGALASVIQRRAQLRFEQTYEVIVSTNNFEIASYSVGNAICKYQEKGFTAIAYATPRQYDADYSMAETFYFTISDQEPLGSSQTSLPGQRVFHTPLSVTVDGTGQPFPVGSHCTAVRAGSKCCNSALFSSMQSSYERVRTNPKFDPYDLRKISSAIQSSAEDYFGTSFETIVSTDDFGIASYYTDNLICKYRIDRYYIMAYATPFRYPTHSEDLIDSGEAQSLDCPENLEALDGVVCCDGNLHRELTRTIDQAKSRAAFNKYDIDGLAKEVLRNVERRFGTTFETVLSRSDFTWKTNIFNSHTCKIDYEGYHVLAVESSANPPPAGDFFEYPVIQNVISAGSNAGGTPTGGACFSTDTWVITPTGKKRMDQLKVGDFVLTANTSTSYFTPLGLWMHREPDVVMMFVTIMTEYGKMLALTSKHLIFRNKCDEYYIDKIDVLPANSEAVYAEDLEVGDCVILLHKGSFRQQRLIDISITQRKGIFAPLTPNGRIIVNDIVASCYSDIKEATLQTTYFSVLTSLRKRLISWLGTWIDQSVDIPFGSEFSMELLRLVVPYIK